MDVVYRMLGIAAAVGNRIGRHSINFIKLNWLLMIGLSAALVGAGNEVRYALANGSKPRELTVTQAVLHSDVDSNYVRLGGELFEEAVFEHYTERGGRKTIEASYYALFDKAKQHAVLVRTTGTSHPEPRRGDAWLAGMLMPLDTQVRQELSKSGGRLGDVAFDTDYVLELGRAPGNATAWSVACALLALALLAMLTAWSNRYVVFRRSGERSDDDAAAATATTDQQAPLWVSGVFQFQIDEHHRRFTSVRSVLVEAEGTPFVCALIDASSSFMGVETSDRRGEWTIALPRTDVREMETGHQYYGLTRRAALRIRHVANGKTRTTVIACATRAQQRAVLDLLRAGMPPPIR